MVLGEVNMRTSICKTDPARVDDRVRPSRHLLRKQGRRGGAFLMAVRGESPLLDNWETPLGSPPSFSFRCVEVAFSIGTGGRQDGRLPEISPPVGIDRRAIIETTKTCPLTTATIANAGGHLKSQSRPGHSDRKSLFNL